MGRTKKPRKRYVPHRVERDPVELAAAMAAALPPATRTRLTAGLRHAFNRMRAGTATWADWSTLADYLNVAEQLARVNLCRDREPELGDAQEALAAVHARHARVARLVLSGPEISALELGVDVAAIQLRYCSQRELQDAIKRAHSRLQQVLAGNARPGALVCEAPR